MHFADLYKVFFANERFSTGIDEHVAAELICLLDDGINVLKRKIVFVAVFCSPAACAAKVTCRCGIKKNCPRYIAVVFLRCNILLFTSLKAGIYHEILEECLAHARIKSIYSLNQLIPGTFFVYSFANEFSLAFVPAFRRPFVDHVHDFCRIVFRIFFKKSKSPVYYKVEPFFFYFFCYYHFKTSLTCSLIHFLNLILNEALFFVDTKMSIGVAILGQ